MTKEDFIIAVLIFMVTVLFIRELKHQNEERDASIMKDKKKAEAIIDTQVKQMEFMKSLNNRVDTLGKVVEILFKIMQTESNENNERKQSTTHD